MYEEFYGLRERPFELTVRPRFIFLTGAHREALATLQYGVTTGRALTLLLGEAGTGKTTLAYAAMENQRGQNITPAYLGNPTITREEFFEWLGGQLKLLSTATGSKTKLLAELERVLGERRARGNPVVLMVDEAQSLPDELLEEVRLLTNLERDEQKLLPVVLLGQPELADRLNEPRLRHVKQRVAVRCTLGPLSARETAAYIAKRLWVAGGDGVSIFTRDAVELIHRRAGGIPRSINVLCDNALVSGFALGRRPVDAAVIDEVASDLDFGADDPTLPSAFVSTNNHRPAGAPAVAVPASGAVVPGARPAAPPLVAPARRRRFFFF